MGESVRMNLALNYALSGGQRCEATEQRSVDDAAAAEISEMASADAVCDEREAAVLMEMKRRGALSLAGHAAAERALALPRQRPSQNGERFTTGLRAVGAGLETRSSQLFVLGLGLIFGKR